MKSHPMTFDSHRQKIRQDLERELSDEFRDRRRENEEFRREIEHQTQEVSSVKGALLMFYRYVKNFQKLPP